MAWPLTFDMQEWMARVIVHQIFMPDKSQIFPNKCLLKEFNLQKGDRKYTA